MSSAVERTGVKIWGILVSPEVKLGNLLLRVYLPLEAARCGIPCNGFSPCTGSYKTAGDGVNTYAAISPVLNTIATKIAAIIELFITYFINGG